MILRRMQENPWIKPLLKLVTGLILLPSLLTYLHLSYIISQEELCFVGPSSPSLPTSLDDYTSSQLETIPTTYSSLISSPLYGTFRPYQIQTKRRGPPNTQELQKLHNRSFQSLKHTVEKAAAENSNDSSKGIWNMAWIKWLQQLTIIIFSQRGNLMSISSVSNSLHLDLKNKKSTRKINSKSSIMGGSELGFIPERDTWCFTPHAYPSSRWNIQPYPPALHQSFSPCQETISSPICLSSINGVEYTSHIDNEKDEKGSLVRLYPPSGEWTFQQPIQFCNSHVELSVQVSCPSSEYMVNPKTIDTNSKNNPSSSSSSSSSWWTKFLSRLSINPHIQNIPINKQSRKQKKMNQTIQEIIKHPTTMMFLALNTYLAFSYWNYRVDPRNVSKYYYAMTSQHEIWRALTGPTAHFELLHLGFNMMSLYALGGELEGSVYSSITFFFLNIVLMIWTTVFMMVIVRLRLLFIRYKRDRSNRGSGGGTNHVHTAATISNMAVDEEQLIHTSSVGYSGVLFAWMVISCLERSQPTCPIPFLSNVCFSTYSWVMWGDTSGFVWKFNISPLVQLAVVQLMFKRASFWGHLSGIICGYLVHWNILSIDVLSSPQVVIPGALLLHWYYMRGILPTMKCNIKSLTLVSFVGSFLRRCRLLSFWYQRNQENGSSHTNEEEMVSFVEQGGGGGREDATSSSEWRYNKRSSNLEQKNHRYLILTKKTMIVVTFFTVFMCNVFSSIMLAQILVTIIFAYAVQCHENVLQKKDSSIVSTSITLWRGAVFSLVLILVTDSMTIPELFLLQTHIETQQLFIFIGPFSTRLYVVVRMFINSFGLILSCGTLVDRGSIGDGIFEICLGWVVRSCKIISSAILRSSCSSQTFKAFEGKGRLLGGGGASL